MGPPLSKWLLSTLRGQHLNVNLVNAKNLINDGKAQGTAPGKYGAAAHTQNPATADRDREALIQILVLVVCPFTCLTESTGKYGIQYKRLSAELGGPINSALNGLTTYTKNLDPAETWYAQEEQYTLHHLNHHWNKGLNICKAWENSVRDTYSEAQCSSLVINAQTVMQHLICLEFYTYPSRSDPKTGQH
ncbi:hypothetical protein JCM16303_004159 [Sporobolomyces ruberrimus]